MMGYVWPVFIKCFYPKEQPEPQQWGHKLPVVIIYKQMLIFDDDEGLDGLAVSAVVGS
jgi:hypothetical protein